MFVQVVSSFSLFTLALLGKCEFRNSWLFKEQCKEWILKDSQVIAIETLVLETVGCTI